VLRFHWLCFRWLGPLFGKRFAFAFLLMALLIGAFAVGPGASASGAGTARVRAGSAPELHVSGNKLVNGAGRQVVLRGVDRSGGEWSCVHGLGTWAGPMNQASVNAMKSWGITVVRIPLNEACWNGQSYVANADRGTTYRDAVQQYVRLLNSNGLAAILDLHFTDGAYTGPKHFCTSALAICEKPMPDAAQAVPFWTSVATTFSGNDSVIFDLFNEPYPQWATGGETSGWLCWRDGAGKCPGIHYQVAGMQSLVNVIRATGANNVLMVGGIADANDLTRLLRYLPADPDHNLAASWHSYSNDRCRSVACWNAEVAPVLKRIPVIAGEIGESGCRDSYIDPLMRWLDGKHASYLAWAWNPEFTCSGGPSLITGYDGTPTAFGAGYRAHLVSMKG
jgi:hypothetical protein